jgi:hypothetical protein
MVEHALTMLMTCVLVVWSLVWFARVSYSTVQQLDAWVHTGWGGR